MEGDSNNNKVLMGRSMSEIPCFRRTFLYSITSGLGAGLVHFMLTSKTKRSMHVGIGTYGCVTLCYWCYCRYNFSKQKFEMATLQKAMQKQAVYEGTELEKQLKEA